MRRDSNSEKTTFIQCKKKGDERVCASVPFRVRDIVGISYFLGNHDVVSGRKGLILNYVYTESLYGG